MHLRRIAATVGQARGKGVTARSFQPSMGRAVCLDDARNGRAQNRNAAIILAMVYSGVYFYCHNYHSKLD